MDVMYPNTAAQYLSLLVDNFINIIVVWFSLFGAKKTPTNKFLKLTVST